MEPNWIQIDAKSFKCVLCGGGEGSEPPSALCRQKLFTGGVVKQFLDASFPQHNATEAGVRELRRSGTSIHGKHLSELDTKKTKVMITDGSMILSRFGLDSSVVLYPDRCNSGLVSVGWQADCRWLASYGRIARQDWQGCAELGWLASLAGGMGLAGLGSWAGVGWNRCRT